MIMFYSNWIGKRGNEDRIKFSSFNSILSIQQLLLLRRLFTIASLLRQTDSLTVQLGICSRII